MNEKGRNKTNIVEQLIDLVKRSKVDYQEKTVIIRKYMGQKYQDKIDIVQ